MDEKCLQSPPATANIGDKANRAGLARRASSKNLNKTYELYQRQNVSQEVDALEARRVLRKIDWHILPLLMGTYMLQFLDKSSINFAVVFGLKKGTNLQNQDYAWLSSIFYFGPFHPAADNGFASKYFHIYSPVASEVPSYNASSDVVIDAVWGVLLITTPACTNFAGIAANRLLLGIFEAVVNPGFVLVMSMWYRGTEQPLRLVTYYSMNGVAGIFGGLLGYAIGHIHTSGALPGPWMYIFLIFGAVSLAWGVVFLVCMPNLPSRARFLAGPDRAVAVERVAANRQGGQEPPLQDVPGVTVPPGPQDLDPLRHVDCGPDPERVAI
ncbi:hypothetical protein PG994_000114 [Apiospora phragmitis]|uniref:Uncharacterized protein n=1 Tax=Apiospora phragmitis TaxID=2905665 RepID=A0ABR1X5D3_9PEZI